MTPNTTSMQEQIEKAVKRFEPIFKRMSKADESLNKPIFNDMLREELTTIVDRSESNLNFIHEQELLFPKKVRKTILVQSEFSGFSKNKLATVINNNVLLQ